MALDIGETVEEAARRTLQRNGLMLVAAFLLLNLLAYFLGLRQGAAARMGPGTVLAPFSGSPMAMGLLGVGVSLISLALSIGAIRVFVTDETETVPDEAFKRNMGSALLHAVVGGVIFGVLVGIGFILLVIPGVYLLLALFFWIVHVAVEDENFYEAMQSSWEMTKGHKWRLLGLLIVIAVVNILLSAVGAIAVFGANSLAGNVVLQGMSAFGGVFALAAQARAYTRLKG